MYGIFMLCVKDLVLKKYSIKEWEAICAEAKVPLDFQSDKTYDDKALIDILYAACKILKMADDELIEAVGYWFVLYMKNTPYGKVLDVMGSSLAEIFSNLNNFHAQLSKVAHFPELASPSFRCSRVKDTSLLLHYVAGKPSRGSIFCPLIIGVVKALSDQFGYKDLAMKQIKFRSKGDDEDVFRVRWIVAEIETEGDSSESSYSRGGGAKLIGLNGRTLMQLFPFHIMFSQDMTIRQVGLSLLKATAIEEGEKMSTYFTIKGSEGASFDDYKSLPRHELFVVQYAYERDTPITLEGELVWMGKRRAFFFACSPVLESLEEIQAIGLSLKDFALREKSSKLGMLLKNVQDHIEFPKELKEESETKDKEKDKDKEKEKGGLLLSIRNKVGAKRRPSQGDSQSAPMSHDFLKPRTPPVSRTPRGKGHEKEKEKDKKEASTSIPSSPRSTGYHSPIAHRSAPMGSSSGRMHAALNEMLLADVWRGFPLTMTLLNAVQQGDTLQNFVVEFYLQANQAELLLQEAFTAEIEKQNATDVLFREDSVATKLFTCYFDRVAKDYINQRVAPIFHVVDHLEHALELDELRKARGSYPLEFCVSKYFYLADTFLHGLYDSIDQCPINMRKIFWYVQIEVAKKAPDMQLPVISNLFFLRLIFPALLHPRFGTVMKESDRRTLAILSKLLLNLVNGIPFGEKEGYMKLLNGFIVPQRRERVIHFLQQFTDISKMSPDKHPKSNGNTSWAKQWGMKCIQNAMLSNLDLIFNKMIQDKQMMELVKNFVAVGLSDAVCM